MFAKRFTIKSIDMPEMMRVKVLDEVRIVIDSVTSPFIQTKQIKESLEKSFGGEWQIIIGEGEIGGFFSKEYIQNYMQLKTQTKTMLIYRRIDTLVPKKKDQFGEYNDIS